MAESWTEDDRPVRAFRRRPDSQFDPDMWPATVPAIAQILRDGLELPAGLTVLVGENGSGKSTVVETLAEAYGLNPQGGSVQARLFRVRDSEPALGSSLVVERAPSWRSHWAYFLRADTMHGMYSYLEENPGLREERFHELSHGEGFPADSPPRSPARTSWNLATGACARPRGTSSTWSVTGSCSSPSPAPISAVCCEPRPAAPGRPVPQVCDTRDKHRIYRGHGGARGGHG